jgi:hypothetical protein
MSVFDKQVKIMTVIRIRLAVLLFLAIHLITGCREKEGINCHRSISFKNNTDKELVVMMDYLYPDTIKGIAATGGYILNADWRVQPGEIGNKDALHIRSCWEARFEGSLMPSDTIMIFVFATQVLESMPFPDVYENYLILKRYDLSLQDLQNLDWQISYPPTEEMKDMKMYPPYNNE